MLRVAAQQGDALHGVLSTHPRPHMQAAARFKLHSMHHSLLSARVGGIALSLTILLQAPAAEAPTPAAAPAEVPAAAAAPAEVAAPAATAAAKDQA